MRTSTLVVAAAAALLSGCVSVDYWRYDPAEDCMVRERRRRPAQHWPGLAGGNIPHDETVAYSDTEGNCIYTSGSYTDSDPWLTSCEEAEQEWCCGRSWRNDVCTDE